MGIIGFLLVGLLAGFIARALVPGPDPMGWLGTLVLGIVGSLVGGTLAALLFGGTLELSAAGVRSAVAHPRPSSASDPAATPLRVAAGSRPPSASRIDS